MTTHRHSAVPNDGPDDEADQGAYPTGHRHTTIPTARQPDQDPEGRTTLTVSKRNGTIVLDPHVPSSRVISLDEHAATVLGNLLTTRLARATP